MAEVVQLHAPFNEREGHATLDRLQFYQKFFRVWSPALNPYELMVMSQIVDRTVGWGVQSIEITTERLRSGDGCYGGIAKGVSRAQLFRALASLEERGCISRRTAHKGVVITLNTRWEPEVIAIPKRLRGTENVQPVADQELSGPSLLETEGSLLETAPVSIGDPLKGTSSKEPLEGNTASQSSYAREENSGLAGIEMRVLAARMKNIEARTGKLRKTKVDPQAVWRNACIEHFPGPPARWSIKDQGRVKTAKKSFVIGSGHSFEEFLQWTVENWAAVTNKKFTWMTQSRPPETPDIGFVIGMYTHFLEAFGTWVYEGWLSDKDRTELERMIANGLSRDEALKQLGKNDAAMKLRKEIAKREADMQRVAAGARADRQQAEKVRAFNERYGTNIPPHPKSRLAQEQLYSTADKPILYPTADKSLVAPKVKFDD